MAETATKDSSDQKSNSSSNSGGGSSTPARRQGPGSSSNATLVTEHGRTSIADTVVAKIAGLACREVSGVHDMGLGVSRTFGSIKEKLPGTSSDPSPTQGVDVEVGERQAAIDLDIVVEYGASIVDVADAIRRNVIGRLEDMTGLEVSEVNVAVDDVYLGESEPDEEPRVQ